MNPPSRVALFRKDRVPLIRDDLELGLGLGSFDGGLFLVRPRSEQLQKTCQVGLNK